MPRLPFLIMIFSLLSPPSGPLGLSLVHAQEVQNEKPEKPKTRRSQVLGKSAFRLIERSQELLAEEKYDEAIAVLKTILESQNFNSYEKAVAIQTSGYIHFGKEDYESAIGAFESAIATGDLPPRVVSDLTYGLAQLHLAKERPRKSLELMEKWFAAQEKEPGGEPFALKAQIHLILDELRSAEQAIKKALSKEEEPKQQWTRILLSVLLQEERYSETLPILEQAVQIWPGVKAFWEQLVAIYYHFEEEDLAFVARRAMHVQGMLVSTRELSSMAQLYLYHDVPIKAADILQTGMDTNRIEKTEKNYELLARAYMQAREWNKAIAPLTRAAEMSDEGKFYAQLAQSHIQEEKWGLAENALVEALNKGGLDDEADNWLLLGIARTRLDKYEAAIRAFRKAGDDDDVAKDAFRWIRSIERRLAENRRAAADQ